MFKQLLRTQSTVYMGASRHALLERLNTLTYPGPGGSLKVMMHGEPPLTVKLPRGDALVDCTALFVALPYNSIIGVLAALLAERRLIFCSVSLSRLCACIDAVNALLFPFKWEHVMIPILPADLLDYTMATFPFCVGFHRSLKSYVSKLPLEQICYVDLDAGGFSSGTADQDFEVLPRFHVKRLLDTISAPMHRQGTHSWNVVIHTAFRKFFAGVLGVYRRYYVGNHLDEEAMVASKSKGSQAFLRAFFLTSMFKQFEHRRRSVPYDDFDLLTERVELELNSGLRGIGKRLVGALGRIEEKLNLPTDHPSSGIHQVQLPVSSASSSTAQQQPHKHVRRSVSLKPVRHSLRWSDFESFQNIHERFRPPSSASASVAPQQQQPPEPRGDLLTFSAAPAVQHVPGGDLMSFQRPPPVVASRAPAAVALTGDLLSFPSVAPSASGASYSIPGSSRSGNLISFVGVSHKGSGSSSSSSEEHIPISSRRDRIIYFGDDSSSSEEEEAVGQTGIIFF